MKKDVETALEDPYGKIRTVDGLTGKELIDRWGEPAFEDGSTKCWRYGDLTVTVLISNEGIVGNTLLCPMQSAYVLASSASFDGGRYEGILAVNDEEYDAAAGKLTLKSLYLLCAGDGKGEKADFRAGDHIEYWFPGFMNSTYPAVVVPFEYRFSEKQLTEEQRDTLLRRFEELFPEQLPDDVQITE